ncbi:hypothetical protein [Halovulum sp. GXIMD14793]
MKYLLSLILMLPTLAFATPPHMVSVTDQVVGINDTHLFLMRSLSYNHGSYYMQQVDQVLISQSIDTGKEESVWPLRQTLEQVNWESDDEEWMVIDKPVPSAVDMMSVLREQSARPINEGESLDTSHLKYSIEDNTLKLQLSYHGEQLKITVEDLSARITASLLASREAIPQIRENNIYELLQHRLGYLEVDACIVRRNHRLWRRTHSNLVLAIQIRCDFDEPLDLYMVLTPDQ